MEDIDISLIKKRSVRGVLALVYRTFAIQLLGFGANLILTIFLSPSVFGVYFVVSAAIAFLSYFSDIGLAAALIQKKEPITDEDLRTTFTIQQALVVTLVIAALLLSGFIKSFYKLDSEGILLFQVLVISFFLSSLKTIPSIILERSLRFDRLVIPQLAESVVFNATAVLLAINGFGVTSFTVAVLLRGIVGLIAIYIISPWKISLGFSTKTAKKLLSFGVPFQANSLLALIKDDLLIVYLGKVLPLSQVGYIGFAQKWAFMPLRLIMDNVIRITFPSFSRLQNDKIMLGKAVEKSLFASAFLIFPSLVALIIFAPFLTKIIPKYAKWEPALMSLTFFSLNACLSSISTPLTNALNAIGKIRTTLYLMIFWTSSTWILTPFLINVFGYNGVSIASFLVATSVFIVVYLVKKYVDFNPTIVFYPVFASIFMGLFLYLSTHYLPSSIFHLSLALFLGLIIYFGIIFMLAKEILLSDFKFIKENIFKKWGN